MCVAIIQGRIKDQLARLEKKTDFLLKHAGLDLDALAGKEIAELLRAGKKIEAIKAYRELTGVGLAEAKTYVETLERMP
jgi:ribosomal protein L7/L12